MKHTVLIVDDEINIRNGLAMALKESNYNVVTAGDGQEGYQQFLNHVTDLALLDLQMPKLNGIELMKKMFAIQESIPVIFITGHGSVENAVEAMKFGAYDFISKPINLEHLELMIARALKFKTISDSNKTLRVQLNTYLIDNLIIGTSRQIIQLKETIVRVANAKGSVYIYGESGTGKELVCEAIHKLGDETRPLIKVNCAALTPSLIESELFGHEKGSFTGAGERKIGRFELAKGGILFLDEISEVPMQTQVKLLRVLQEKRIERVGGVESIPVDFRVVCASNKNLNEEVKKGNFREDLFYRLNVLDIEVPPLRERKSDILLLARHFFSELLKAENLDSIEITPQVYSKLMQYEWPGNVRELTNIIEKTIVMGKNKHGKITVNDLPSHIIKLKNKVVDINLPLGIPLSDAERRFIEATINFCGGNKSEAATMLKMGRKTLYRKVGIESAHKSNGTE